MVKSKQYNTACSYIFLQCFHYKNNDRQVVPCKRQLKFYIQKQCLN